MKKLAWIGMLLPLCLWLAGCASTVRSDVTAFHQWDPALAGATFAFERTGEQADSLEHKTYEGMVRQELLHLGLKEVPTGQARLIVQMRYAVQPRDVTVREDIADPFWYDPWWPYRGRWWPAPYYWGQRETTMRIYERSLTLGIREKTAQGRAKVFEATAKSEGRIGQLANIMPYLVRSVFADFPGASGKTREVSLPYED